MVKTKKFSRIVAMLLTLVMLLTIVPFQGLAAEADPAELQLKDGTVALTEDMSDEQVKKALFDALVVNPEGKDYHDYSWEYYTNGNHCIGGDPNNAEGAWRNPIWVTVDGAVIGSGIFNMYRYWPLKHSRIENADHRVRVVGNSTEVTATKTATASVTYTYDELQGSVLVNDKQVSGTVTGLSPASNLYFTVEPNTGYEVESVKVNGVELEANQGVYTILPAASTAVDVTFRQVGNFYNVTVKAGEGVNVSLNGVPVSGDVKVSADEKYELTYTPDENTSIKNVKFGDSDVTSDVAFNNYVGSQFVKFTADTTITVDTISKNEAIAFTDERNVNVAVNADGSFNFNGIRTNLISALVDTANSVGVAFTPENVVFEQYAQRYFGAGTPVVNTFDWVALEGQKTTWDYHNPISIGSNHLRARFLGNEQFRPTDYVEFDINLVDIQKSAIALKDTRTVNLYETATGVIDYSDLEKRVFEVSVDTEKSVPQGMTFDDVDVTVPENITTSGDYQVTVKFRGTTSYYASEVTFPVHFNVVNLPTAEIKLNTNYVSAELKETEIGVFDVESLKKTVFEAAVDTANSNPANLTYEDVKITFNGDVTKGGKFTATITYAGTSEMHGTSADVTVDVEVVSLPTIKIEAQSRDLVLNKNVAGDYDYDGLKKSIFDECLKVTGVEGLAWNNFVFEYKLFNGIGTSDSWSGHYRDFAIRNPSFDLEETYKYLYKGGNFQIRVSIPDSSSYHGASAEFTINVTVEDPYYEEIALKENYQKNFVLNYADNGEYDYNRLKKEIFDAVIDLDNSPSNVTFDNVSMTYQLFNALGTSDSWSGHFREFDIRKPSFDLEETYKYLYKGGDFNIKVAAPGDENHRAVEVVFSVYVQPFSRVPSNVVLNSGTMDYRGDLNAIKEYVYSLIDMKTSKLPADVSIDNFTFEYYARNYTAGDIPGVEHRWVPFEGMTHPTLAGSYFKPIGNGTNRIRVVFNGTDDYISSTSNEAELTISKASFSISLKQNYKYLDENLPSDFVRPSVNDNFEHYYIALDASSSTGIIYIDSLSGLGELDFTGNVALSWWLTQILGAGVTADSVYNRDGLSREQLIKLLSDSRMIDFLEGYNIDANAVSKMLDIINSVPESVTHFSFKMGQPTKPGTYTMFAMATNANYYTATVNSVFYVKYHSTGTKLVFVQDTSGLNIFKAKNFDFSAVVTKDGVPVSSSNVKYIYTGFRANALFYGSTKEPPREAGIYTQTAWTAWFTSPYAFPKTRTFTISLL